MIQLNPASLDSENSMSESKTLYKKPTNTNRTLKNKKSVSFLDNQNDYRNNIGISDVGDNNITSKSKITNISNLLSKLHENPEDEEINNNYQHNLIDSSISSSLNNSLTNELNKLQESRLTGETNNMHNVHNLQSANNINNGNNANFPNLAKSNNHNNTNISANANANASYTNYDDGYNLNYNNLNNDTLLDNNKLLSKLDYVIHLLEEQHNEKTNHITEELILYLFLGIFMIFVLDSFARASKYVR